MKHLSYGPHGLTFGQLLWRSAALARHELRFRSLFIQSFPQYHMTCIWWR